MLLLALGESASLSLCEARIFLQAVLLSTKWESPQKFICQVHPGEGKRFFAEKSVGFRRGFAGEYDGPLHPHGG